MSAISTFMAATRPSAPVGPTTEGQPDVDVDVVRLASRALSAIDGGATTLTSITEMTGLSVAAAVAALDWLSSARLVLLSQSGDALNAELTNTARAALSPS